MIILGLNAFHADASACLVRDGVLIAAAEEERFRRIKHWAGFPSEAIGYCLAAAGIDLGEVDHIAINQDGRANLKGKFNYLVRNRPTITLIVDRLRNRSSRDRLPELLTRAFPNSTFSGGVDHVEHHLAHLSSAFHVSPFKEAVIVSVDGFGDFSSGAWGVGRGTEIIVDGRVLFPHSLGVFYQAVTQYLGFPNYGDEYKVMGLAPYGNPKYLSEMQHILRFKPDGGYELDLSFFRHQNEKIRLDSTSGTPGVVDLFKPALEKLLGPRRYPDQPLEDRHRDIARSTQAMYEAAFINLCNIL